MKPAGVAASRFPQQPLPNLLVFIPFNLLALLLYRSVVLRLAKETMPL